MRYSIQSFFKALSNPEMFVSEATRVRNKYGPVSIWEKSIVRLNNRRFAQKYGDGMSIMDHDWDNLIILDACRYDTFKQHNWIEGDLRKVVSKGSQTREFTKKNFTGNYYDTIYVSSNANSFKQRFNLDSKFHKLIPTFVDERESSKDNYSPSNTYQKSIDAHNEFPNKRMIVHFVQPHAPYFGEKAKELRQKLYNQNGIVFYAWLNEYDNCESNLPFKEIKQRENTYRYLMKAAELIPSEKLEEVYVENLNIVLEYVERLINELNGCVESLGGVGMGR